MELIDRPLGYIGPNLNPTGVQFRPKLLAQGVFALLTSPVLRDNSDCIVGHRGVLVVDSGVNGPIARQNPGERSNDYRETQCCI